MTTRPYYKGRRAEYRAMHLLKKQGYVCERASGSHGPFDVLAFKPNEIRLIQVKMGNEKKARLTHDAWIMLGRLANWLPFASIEVWHYRPRGRRPAIVKIEQGKAAPQTASFAPKERSTAMPPFSPIESASSSAELPPTVSGIQERHAEWSGG